jgi:hypothetical protein
MQGLEFGVWSVGCRIWDVKKGACKRLQMQHTCDGVRLFIPLSIRVLRAGTSSSPTVGGKVHVGEGLPTRGMGGCAMRARLESASQALLVAFADPGSGLGFEV